MENRGKIAVIAMFLVAFLMSSGAWWWSYQRSQKSLAFWGKDSAFLIRHAETVTLLELGKPYEKLSGNLNILREIDLSKANGLVNARHPFSDDASYRWDASTPTDSPPANYTIAVRFTRQQKTATILFDFENQRLMNGETHASVAMVPKISDGWQKVAHRHLEEK